MIAQAIEFEDKIATWVYRKSGIELRAPDEFVVTIRIAAVNRLAERLIEAFDQDDELRLYARQVFGRLAVERTRFVDRVNHGPCQRKEQNAAAFQIQQFELPLGLLGSARDSHQHHLRLHLHQIVGALIRNAEHHPASVLIRCDEGVRAVADGGGRLGGARDKKPRNHGETQQPRERLQRRADIRGQSVRGQIPVADGCQRVRAEEEVVEKAPRFGSGCRSRHLTGSHREVREREQGVHCQIEAEHEGGEARPTHSYDVQPGMEGAPVRAGTADVERTVFVNGAPERRAKLACQPRIESRLLHR